MSGQGPGQVKVHNEAFSHFGFQAGWLDGLQRAHTHPKCWVNVREGHCMRIKGILKNVRLKVYSHKVTIKEKPQTCRATHVFWVILHADIDGDSHLTLRRHPI